MRRIELKFNIKEAVLIISSLMIFAIYNINNYTNLKNEKSIICMEAKGKVKAKAKKTYITKNSSGAYNVLGTIVVNKKYGLSKDYTYKNNKQMFDKATNAFNKMQQDAQKDGINLYIISRYRSYSLQKWLYDKYKSESKDVDTFSAKAGYSEHQTGLAFYLNDSKTSVRDSFEFTDAYKWLKENAYKYGFILRYPKGKSDITGYKFEPWHYRYVGTELSYKLKDHTTTLEEYLNICK